MSKHLIFGIIFLVIALLGIGLFIFDWQGLKRFGRLTFGSKMLTIFLAVLSLAMVTIGGWFSFKNFTYSPPAKTETNQALQKQIDKAKVVEDEYQAINDSGSMRIASLDQLYQTYSPEGQGMIDNWSQGSDKTKALLLRNVGRDYNAKDGLDTKIFTTLLGEDIDLSDGVQRIVFFADNSEYSLSQLQFFREFIKKNSQGVELLVIFPTLDGTKVQEFYQVNSGALGSMEENNIVTLDSMPTTINQSLYNIAVTQFGITDLPSYVAVDSKGIVSNAGVGSLINSREHLNSWIAQAFNSDSKLYLEIKNVIQEASLEAPAEQAEAEGTQSSATNEGAEAGQSQPEAQQETQTTEGSQ